MKLEDVPSGAPLLKQAEKSSRTVVAANAMRKVGHICDLSGDSMGDLSGDSMISSPSCTLGESDF